MLHLGHDIFGYTVDSMASVPVLYNDGMHLIAVFQSFLRIMLELPFLSGSVGQDNPRFPIFKCLNGSGKIPLMSFRNQIGGKQPTFSPKIISGENLTGLTGK